MYVAIALVVLLAAGGLTFLLRRGAPRRSPPPPVRLFDEATGDAAYLAARNFVTWRPVREALEQAWTRVWPLCPDGPGQFACQFRQDFHGRSWELFLLTVIIDAGLTVEPTGEAGPDICVRLPSGRRLWIEAVVPRPGTGPNAVPQRGPNFGGGSLPRDSTVILRYTQALREKLRQLNAHKAAGIVAPDDAYLIALSQGGILDSDLQDDELPLIARAVLGIGQTTYNFVPYSDQPGWIEVPRREHVATASGSPVSTTFLLEAETEFVSGIIFARQAVYNLRWSAAESLGLLHRPRARVPLPHGVIPTRCEMWVDEEGTLLHRGKCAMFGNYAREVIPLHRRVLTRLRSLGQLGIRFRVWRLTRHRRLDRRGHRPNLDVDLF